MAVEERPLPRAYICDACGARHEIPRAELALMLTVECYRYWPTGWYRCLVRGVGDFLFCTYACKARWREDLLAAADTSAARCGHLLWQRSLDRDAEPNPSTAA